MRAICDSGPLLPTSTLAATPPGRFRRVPGESAEPWPQLPRSIPYPSILYVCVGSLRISAVSDDAEQDPYAVPTPGVYVPGLPESHMLPLPIGAVVLARAC